MDRDSILLGLDSPLTEIEPPLEENLVGLQSLVTPERTDSSVFMRPAIANQPHPPAETETQPVQDQELRPEIELASPFSDVVLTYWQSAIAPKEKTSFNLLTSPDGWLRHSSSSAAIYQYASSCCCSICVATTAAGSGEDGLVAAAMPGTKYSLDAIPSLSSNPNARAKIYLDFNGHRTIVGWGTQPGGTNYNNGQGFFTPAADFDGDSTTFSDQELQVIRGVWAQIAEDYAPFNVDVTTIEPIDFSANIAKRYVFGGLPPDAPSGAVGLAIVGGWRQHGDLPGFALFRPNATTTTAIQSHEIGHTLGLTHQSIYDAQGNKVAEYGTGYDASSGYGSAYDDKIPGDITWSPTMGSAGSNNTFWYNRTNTRGSTVIQDDIAIIAAANNALGYKADDHGNTNATATILTGVIAGAGIIIDKSLDAQVLEFDVDVFQFTAIAGDLLLKVDVQDNFADLDAKASLFDSLGNLITSDEPLGSQDAIINTNLSTGGNYFLHVQSNGRYGRIGNYTFQGISGTTPGFQPLVQLGAPFNPFAGVTIANTPIWADIDGDGDQDAFVDKRFFRNDATSTSPQLIEITGAANPLNTFNFDTRSDAPAFADIDADGDLDLFTGNFGRSVDGGGVKFYRNTGSAKNPVFILTTGAEHPFNNLVGFYRNKPTFVDIDQDGDLDAFLGASDGTIKFFKNIGSGNIPNFVRDDANNPLPDDVGDRSGVTFADLDGDGDFDAFAGNQTGEVRAFQNIGTATQPFFVETGTANPFTGLTVSGGRGPSFVDLDADGDLDAFVNNLYFNNQLLAAPIATNDSTLTSSSQPIPISILANDRIADGSNLSLLSFSATSSNGGSITRDENGTPGVLTDDRLIYTPVNFLGTDSFTYTIANAQGKTATATVTVDVIRKLDLVPTPPADPAYAVPFEEPTVITVAHTPIWADIDSDGDQDAFVDNRFYRNNGNANNPQLDEVTGTANPLNEITISGNNPPAFVDIDGDRDLDLFTGGYEQNSIKFYRNTGSAKNPSFTEVTSADNPFSNKVPFYLSKPAFGDLDGDGDADALIGRYGGTIEFYQNTGTANSPSFVQVTGSENKFNGVDIGDRSGLNLADVDQDGDLDAFLANQTNDFVNQPIRYFANVGTTTIARFAEATGSDNPFNGVPSKSSRGSSFVDIDGDGDLDAYVLNQFFLNTAPLPTSDDVTVAQSNSGTAPPINSEDAGYPAAAMRDRLTGEELEVGDEGTATAQVEMQDSSIFDSFILPNGGTPEQYIDSTAVSPVYFSEVGANPQPVDHLRLLVNTFGFEDLLAGGNVDYNNLMSHIPIVNSPTNR